MLYFVDDKMSEEGKMAPFKDRRDAGRKLAQKLATYAGQPNVLILALPRGGVPVGYEVALALNAPLDIFIVRKLGLPGPGRIGNRSHCIRRYTRA